MSEDSVWNVWKAIEAQHQQHDASLRHEAWTQLFDYRSKTDRVTPSDFTPAKRSEELGLFIIINAGRR